MASLYSSPLKMETSERAMSSAEGKMVGFARYSSEVSARAASLGVW